MSWACWNLTTSMVTMSEIGMRLLYRMMNVRISSINSFAMTMLAYVYNSAKSLPALPRPLIVLDSAKYHCWLEKNHCKEGE